MRCGTGFMLAVIFSNSVLVCCATGKVPYRSGSGSSSSSNNTTSSSSSELKMTETMEEIVVGLPFANLKVLEKAFWDISTPDSGKYMQYMSLKEVADIIAPRDDLVINAYRWLVEQGATAIIISPLRDRMSAIMASEKASDCQALLESRNKQHELNSSTTEAPHYLEFFHRRRRSGPGVRGHDDSNGCSGNSDGSNSRGKGNAFGGSLNSRREEETLKAYSIPKQKRAYGIPENLTAKTGSVLQMVWGPGTFGFDPRNLQRFTKEQCPNVDVDRQVKFDPHSVSHGQPGGDNWGEGSLDVEMISCFGTNVTTWVSNTNTSDSTEEGQGFGLALLEFLTDLASRPEEQKPHVLSLSLGSLSASSCDLLCTEAEKLGHNVDSCRKFMQKQRQVCMFISEAQVSRISVALQVLGIRGVTVFGSSGDGGSHFSFQPFEGGALANDLNKISCEYQIPVFPTSSPYITSVGGTIWKGDLVPDSSSPIAWSGSGGGFSRQFPMPSYQSLHVSRYLNSTKGLPDRTSFNSKMRAYPDISAVAVEGTSQSSPTIAGIFSLLTDLRLQKGLKPLGHLGPRLYANAEKFPFEAFQDVTEGNSRTFCDNGFPCSRGWDPVTGLGRPIWSGLVKHFASDDTL
eukprot:CAMPEP_0184481504 /NCGR_PEP_ID=MMETSP0113_2-20130426/3059_1 /TAXON_ID=91329 /ORGANISM="Norrisiella sphaerica, Strain BC52" /LENGTH=628 /DNA_ID=CAMNT_0026860673 /DNA_START=94 /DNA_END=1980 /DNA_ORIENTATION=+